MKYNFFIFLIIIFASCTSQKKMIYLQGSGVADSTNNFINKSLTYKIHTGDILYVKVLSLNKEINSIFNFDYDASNNYTLNNEISMYYKGYTVSEDGHITLPVIGKVLAIDKTIEELQTFIQTTVDTLLKDAQVIVKFGGFKYTVLGEVKKPGLYSYYNNKLTILEALGEAGDLTDMGNRKNVLIIRPTQTGSVTYRVNLLDKKLLEDPNFYLTPNDVVYVEPVKTKNWKLNAPNISIILSSITTTILVINFIRLTF